MTREKEIAAIISASQTWDIDLLSELCDIAGLSSEWASADGNTFETVAYAAAGKLGVDLHTETIPGLLLEFDEQGNGIE